MSPDKIHDFNYPWIYIILINDPLSFLNSVLPLLVVTRISAPLNRAFIASPLPIVRTNEPLSLRSSTLHLTVDISINK